MEEKLLSFEERNLLHDAHSLISRKRLEITKAPLKEELLSAMNAIARLLQEDWPK